MALLYVCTFSALKVTGLKEFSAITQKHKVKEIIQKYQLFIDILVPWSCKFKIPILLLPPGFQFLNYI